MNKSMSKQEKNDLVLLVQKVNVNDENSVFDLAVELGKWSNRLRCRIIQDDDSII